MAMLIPSIDLMGGKIVQLVQGERKALEFDDFEEWIARFSSFPLIQLIDLDAALGNGNNRDLVQTFSRRLPCQVGGGIRSTRIAEQMLSLGAKRVISDPRSSEMAIQTPRLRKKQHVQWDRRSWSSPSILSRDGLPSAVGENSQPSRLLK